MARLSKIAKSVAVAAVVALGVTAGNLTSASAAARTSPMPASIKPSPVFLKPNVCGLSGPNDTRACNSAILQAIDNARKTLKIPAVLHSFSLVAFDRLGPREQLLAIADIERTARGLAPIAGLTTQLDAVALAGARAQTDPSIPSFPRHALRLSGGGEATYYGSNFAEGTANAMGADYYWMYDDGLGAGNIDCTARVQSGCWGHRDNILAPYSEAKYCPRGSRINIVMGAAEVTSRVKYSPAITEIFTNDCGALPGMDSTWASVKRLIFPT
jgi:hypothetical protein